MQEKILKAKPGMPFMILFILLYLAAVALIIAGGVLLDRGVNVLGAVILVAGILWVVFGFIPFLGLKIIKPQEALVLTLFGEYIGTLKEPGF
ncbi:MAG: SPFH domain-containing protein, partial [Limnochordia bacterium]